MRCFTIVFLLAASGAAHASNFTVTNANDAGPGSLRQAITDANADANEPHTITIQASGINVTAIKDVTPMPHNGCRARKRRRV
jgi:ribosomal protein S11